MTGAAPQLEYAPGAPIRRRRRLRRVVGVVLLASFGLGVWWFHGPVWRHAKLLYYERQCLNYTAPPEQVVYDENYGMVSPLIGSAGYRAVPDWRNATIKGSTKPVAGVAVRPAPQWWNYEAALGWSIPIPAATVFLHELRTKAGLVRLVAILRLSANPGYNGYDFGLWPLVISPAGLLSQPDVYQTRIRGGSRVLWTDPADTQNLRFYASQCDPADAAHFTIKYDLVCSQNNQKVV